MSDQGKAFSEEISWKDICQAQKNKVEIPLGDLHKDTVSRQSQGKVPHEVLRAQGKQ
jgi:hypothetical protein